MSESSENLIDILDDYLAFKRECELGVEGSYFGWLYGHIESNERYEIDRAALAARFAALTAHPIRA